MTDDRESPSGGWREVYREMEADADVEAPTRRCPDCGRTCETVLRDAYECPDNGVFRPSTDGGGAASDTESADDPAEGAETADADERPEGENDGGEQLDGLDSTNRLRRTAD
jgi:hypothetical protein